MPAVLGIQAAEEPRRYIAISKIRQAMKVATIEEVQSDAINTSGGRSVSRMYLPESGERATTFDGDEVEVAQQIIKVLSERGVL